jgi:transcriptional regulator with XRE-family HTH domain
MITNKSVILNKIKSHLGYKKEKDFAEFLGISPQHLSLWRRRNSYDLDLLYEKCKIIDANFLLTGEGNMILGQGKDDLCKMCRKKEQSIRELEKVIETKEYLIKSKDDVIEAKNETIRALNDKIAILEKAIASYRDGTLYHMIMKAKSKDKNSRNTGRL